MKKCTEMKLRQERFTRLRKQCSIKQKRALKVSWLYLPILIFFFRANERLGIYCWDFWSREISLWKHTLRRKEWMYQGSSQEVLWRNRANRCSCPSNRRKSKHFPRDLTNDLQSRRRCPSIQLWKNQDWAWKTASRVYKTRIWRESPIKTLHFGIPSPSAKAISKSSEGAQDS